MSDLEKKDRLFKKYLDEYDKSDDKDATFKKFKKIKDEENGTLRKFLENRGMYSSLFTYDPITDEDKMNCLEMDVEVLTDIIDLINRERRRDEIKSNLDEYLFKKEGGTQLFKDRYLSFCRRVLSEATNKFKTVTITSNETNNNEIELCHPYAVHSNYIPDFDKNCYINHGIIEFRAYCKSIYDNMIVDEFMVSDFFMYHLYDDMTEERIAIPMDELILTQEDIINEAMDKVTNNV